MDMKNLQQILILLPPPQLLEALMVFVQPRDLEAKILYLYFYGGLGQTELFGRLSGTSIKEIIIMK